MKQFTAVVLYMTKTISNFYSNTYFYFSCKAIIWFLVVLYIILGIFITLGNFTVILVYSIEKKMRHSQDIFRLFLGVADIIVGLVTFPAGINTMLKIYQHTFQPQTPIHIFEQEQFIFSNGSYIYKNATLTMNFSETTKTAGKNVFLLVYKNTIGFFTTVSYTVSIYLLTVSGIDRLRAFSKPLHYNQDVAKRFAILSSIVCWILAIFVSVLPIFVNGLSYKISFNAFVLFKGKMAFFLYLVMMILPLVATWIILGLIYIITRRALNKNKNLSTNHDNVKKQRKLNFILSLMVAAFSFSILPSVLVLIVLFFIPGINPKSPETFNLTNYNIVYLFEFTAIIILASNSLWNFLIYSLRIKAFRKAASEKYKRIWNLIICCQLFSKRKK